MVDMMKVILPAIAAFIGSLSAIYFKEKIHQKKQIKIQLKKLSLAVHSLKRMLLEQPFNELYMAGIYISSEQMEAMNRGTDDFENELEIEKKIKEEIRTKYKNDEKLKEQIFSLYNEKVEWSDKYFDYKLNELRQEKEGNTINGISLDDIHLLPGNIPIQAMMTKYYYDKIVDWAIDFSHIVNCKIVIKEELKIENVITLIITIFDLSKQLNSLDKNIKLVAKNFN